jgi:5-methyltetrahydrofolate--homocysteine methyltransferase
MIGGAPITQEFADEIGADGYAPDVASAVEKAKKFLKELRR